jgi:hypothetical protein
MRSTPGPSAQVCPGLRSKNRRTEGVATSAFATQTWANLGVGALAQTEVRSTPKGAQVCLHKQTSVCAPYGRMSVPRPSVFATSALRAWANLGEGGLRIATQPFASQTFRSFFAQVCVAKTDASQAYAVLRLPADERRAPKGHVGSKSEP